MSRLLAVAAGLGTMAALIALVLVARRRLRIVRALTFVLCLAAVAAGLAVYKATGVHLLPEFETFFVWLVASLAAITVLRIIGLYVFDVHLRIQRRVQLPPLLPSLTLAVAYLIAAIAIMRAVYPGVDLAPLLATSAVTSLVLGLALQPILGNFFAGVAISFERPFRINDWIKVGDVEGRVVEITWRTTHVRTRDNDDLIIPNAKAADEYILNFYTPNPLHLTRVFVGAQYSAAPYRVRQVLLECALRVPGVLEKPTPDVYIRDFAESTISYELRVWIEDIAAVDRIKSDLRFRIWESFQRHGLSFPFPTRTLEFAPAPHRDAEGAAPAGGRLYIAEGPLAGTHFRLGAKTTTVGRTPGHDIAIADAGVSKNHARIDASPDGFVLVDLQSSGGTFVNGLRIERHVLVPFDRVTLGATVLVFEHDGH